jgi:mono/diheme cytochrome c family protein
VAIALADPVYLAIADKEAMRKVIANGVRGTSMPAFAQSAGGMLTDKQVDVITSEIRSRWSRPGILDGANPPSYAAKSAGNAQQGEVVYRTYCASCHGPAGQGGPKGSSITNDSFLALVTNQRLRTIVIAGYAASSLCGFHGVVRLLGTNQAGSQFLDCGYDVRRFLLGWHRAVANLPFVQWQANRARFTVSEPCCGALGFSTMEHNSCFANQTRRHAGFLGASIIYLPALFLLMVFLRG